MQTAVRNGEQDGCFSVTGQEFAFRSQGLLRQIIAHLPHEIYCLEIFMCMSRGEG